MYIVFLLFVVLHAWGGRDIPPPAPNDHYSCLQTRHGKICIAVSVVTISLLIAFGLTTYFYFCHSSFNCRDSDPQSTAPVFQPPDINATSISKAVTAMVHTLSEIPATVGTFNPKTSIAFDFVQTMKTLGLSSVSSDACNGLNRTIVDYNLCLIMHSLARYYDPLNPLTDFGSFFLPAVIFVQYWIQWLHKTAPPIFVCWITHILAGLSADFTGLTTLCAPNGGRCIEDGYAAIMRIRDICANATRV